MIAKYLIKKIVSLRHASIKEKYCINVRNKKAECERCIHVCDAKAIRRENGKPIIDEALCEGCGVCHAVCPSSAVEIAGFYKKIDGTRIHEKDQIIIGCEKQQTPMDIRFPCLNGLHIEYITALILLLKGKKIYLNRSGCKNCDIKSSWTIDTAVNRAEKFLNDLGCTFGIEIIHNKEDLPKYNEAALTRRQIFDLIGKRSSNTAKDIINQTIMDLKENNINHRQVLLKEINEVTRDMDENTSLPHSIFTSWRINSNCDGCGFCQAICPWNAWEIENKGEVLLIRHSAGKCRSCGLCSKFCPNTAIEKDEFLLDCLKKSKVKRKIPLIICQKCSKKYVAENSQGNLCPNCAKIQIKRR